VRLGSLPETWTVTVVVDGGEEEPVEAERVEDGGLADSLGVFARSLQAEVSIDAMLLEVVASAVTLVPGAEAASISVVRHRRVTSEHASSELARSVDEVQTEVGQGPALDAIAEKRTVRVPYVGDEPRWPLFARRAHELGAGSMLAFRLFVQGDTLGALTLVSRSAGAFDEESEQTGLVFASHAALAYAGARRADDLVLAVEGRDLIGQAKGILMERYALDETRAFAVLVRISQTTQRKLAAVAHELATTGQLAGLLAPEQEDSLVAPSSGPRPH
jgi:transcriptional regulator with GAF, ATPase, and Fis domain